MIRLLDLPGLAEIEARVRLNALTANRGDPELDRMVEAFIRDVLQVVGNTADMLWEHYYFSSLDAGMGKSEALAVANGTFAYEYGDDEPEITEIESWREDGWDVRGDDGAELICLPMIEEVLQCVDEGICGRSKVELEALIWTNRKAAEAAKLTPKDRARNQQFLSLGTPSRRRA